MPQARERLAPHEVRVSRKALSARAAANGRSSRSRRCHVYERHIESMGRSPAAPT